MSLFCNLLDFIVARKVDREWSNRLVHLNVVVVKVIDKSYKPFRVRPPASLFPSTAYSRNLHLPNTLSFALHFPFFLCATLFTFSPSSRFGLRVSSDRRFVCSVGYPTLEEAAGTEGAIWGKRRGGGGESEAEEEEDDSLVSPKLINMTSYELEGASATDGATGRERREIVSCTLKKNMRKNEIFSPLCSARSLLTPRRTLRRSGTSISCTWKTGLR